MKLRKYFDLLDREWVASWLNTPQVCEAFCGLSRVTNRMFEEWYDADDQLQWILENEEREPVAYGKIWTDSDSTDVELAHLLVSTEFRHQGVGRQLVQALVEQVRKDFPQVKRVLLRVDPELTHALQFARKTEFQELKEIPEDWIDEYVWFVYNLKS